MSARLCWTCEQPATHSLTRDGSIPLDACDNCTRIDRAEAESRGWTITPIAQAMKPRHVCRPPFMARTGSCDCSRCCAAAPHEKGCQVTETPECTCPDEAEEHAEDCPEWLFECEISDRFGEPRPPR